MLAVGGWLLLYTTCQPVGGEPLPTLAGPMYVMIGATPVQEYPPLTATLLPPHWTEEVAAPVVLVVVAVTVPLIAKDPCGPGTP